MKRNFRFQGYLSAVFPPDNTAVSGARAFEGRIDQLTGFPGDIHSDVIAGPQSSHATFRPGRRQRG